MKELFSFLAKSKIIQISIAASLFVAISILALSFGGSLYVQSKNGCFDKIISNIVEEVKE